MTSVERELGQYQSSELIRYPKTNATGLAQQYGIVLRTLINLHACWLPKDLPQAS